MRFKFGGDTFVYYFCVVGQRINENVFCERYSARIGQPMMLYTKDLRVEGNLLYLPVYMTPFI